MPNARERILFVDDEPMVLRGMHRILQPYADRWDMVFAEGAKEALDHLAKGPFDAIVSDLRMPEMNGADLLNEVRLNHPRTIRIALSGYADRNLMLQCVTAAHQHIAKPCNAEKLESVLVRLTELVKSKRDEPVRNLLTRCSVLPSVPEVYSELVSMLNNVAYTVEELGTVVARDPAMSTRVLALVNSSFYGLRGKIADPGEAVLFLGVDTMKSLVLGTHLFQPLPQRLPAGFSAPRLWAHSLRCAEAAHMIARSLGANQQVAHETYIAGLMHDIGKLLLAANLPEEYGEAIGIASRPAGTLTAAERERFGADHAEVGGYYLGLLGLPVPIIDAITYHHNPAEALDKLSIPLIALHVGNVIAAGEPPVTAVPTSRLDREFIAARGLTDDLEIWRQTWLARSTRGPSS